MKRITMKIMLIILAVSLVNCPAFYNINKKESKHYTIEETVILEKTSKSLDYDFGYDPDVDLDYIFEFSKTKKDVVRNDREFLKVIENIKPESYVNFYEKILRLKFLTEIRIKEYKNEENWKYSTYIEKYMLPPLENYLAFLEKNIVNKDKEYARTLPDRKKAVEKKLHLDLQKEKADKEFIETYKD